jgi:hypothetical protein
MRAADVDRQAGDADRGRDRRREHHGHRAPAIAEEVTNGAAYRDLESFMASLLLNHLRRLRRDGAVGLVVDAHHREIAGVGRANDSRDAGGHQCRARCVLEQVVPLIVTVVVMLAAVRPDAALVIAVVVEL